MGAGKLWSEESQEGPLQLHSFGCPDFVVCEVTVQVLGDTVLKQVTGACCSPRERRDAALPSFDQSVGYPHSAWDYFSDGTTLVIGLMPGCRLSWCLSAHSTESQQEAPTKSHPCFPSAPSFKALHAVRSCKSWPRSCMHLASLIHLLHPPVAAWSCWCWKVQWH